MAIGDFSPQGQGAYRPDHVRGSAGVGTINNDRNVDVGGYKTPEKSRALVPTGPARAAKGVERRVRSGPVPAFLAQLIAHAVGAEQTRVRRRASPADTRSAYLEAEKLARPGKPVGRRLRRSV